MAKKLENIKIFMCPLTDKIYAGYFNKTHDISTDKIEVTNQALVAVIKHMNRDKNPREVTFFEGTLKWIPNKD